MRMFRGLKVPFLLTLSMIMLNTATVSHSSAIPARNDSSNSSSEQHHGIEVAGVNFKGVRAPLVFTVVVLLAGLSKIGFHYANFLSSKVPESCMLIVLGTIFGAIIHFSGAAAHLPVFFSPHDFFLFLLPPIILESAYSLHDRTFFDNIGSVLLFAVVGTIVACFLLGLTLYGLAISGAMGVLPFNFTLVQIFVFSSLIVAVDPVAVLAVFQEVGVNHVLYFLVFGESLLNDGVTVVLYKVMQTYNTLPVILPVQIVLGVVKFLVVCFGGLFLGLLAGIFSAILTKYTAKVKVVQPLVIYTMAYLGFLMAELYEFSGIISIIACGLTQMQYAFHNISEKSRTTLKYFTKVISSASEIVIFLFLGLTLVREDHVWHTGFILWSIFFCLVYRFLITFSMSFLINRFDSYRVRKIGLAEQFMISYGGLRGAVCFSLVAMLKKEELPMKNLYVTATLTVIMFTVFVQGISIKPLVRVLQVRLAPEKHLSMYTELSNHITDHMMAGVEDIIGFHGRYHFKEVLENFEDKYVRRWLQREPERSDSEIKAFYEKIVLKEHFKYLELCGAKSVPQDVKIPHIDTSMYLSKMTKCESSSESEEAKPEEEPEDTTPVMRRRKFHHDIDAKGLRSLLQSQHSSRFLLHSNYDKNLTTEHRSSLVNQIQRKTAKNRRLQRLMSTSTESPPPGRPRSWSEHQAEICEKRGENPSHSKPHGRSKTVDLGDTARMGVYLCDSTPGSPSLDAVFEDDETDGKEGVPLINVDSKKQKDTHSQKPASLKQPTLCHHELERQDAVEEIQLEKMTSSPPV